MFITSNTKRVTQGLTVLSLFHLAAFAANFTVNSAADIKDDNPGDGTCRTGKLEDNAPECTLRAAVHECTTINYGCPVTVPQGRFNLIQADAKEVGLYVFQGRLSMAGE